MDFSKWEEDIYWTHFKHLHFSQFLLDDFHHQLAIPKKFSAKKKLPDCVTLKGPGGGTWKVGVVTLGNSVFFKHGWPEFVYDHFLGENDLLVFKYNGESLFEVLIFDGQTLCEKEASYFVKRREQGKNDPVSSLMKRKLRENSCDKTNNACSENAGFALLEKSTVDDNVISPSEEQVITPTKNETGCKKLAAFRPIRSCRSAIIKESPRDVQMQLVPKNDAKHTPNRRRGYANEYVSNRRPITEEEKSKALELAEAEISLSNKGGLPVVMKASYVYKRYYVVLPLNWVTKYITIQNQDLYIRYGEKEWRTRFNFNKKRRSAGITSGWKHFAVDNNLEQFDVCIFEPGHLVNDSVCVDAKIFRVVPEVTRLTPVDSPKSEKSGRKSRSFEIEEDELINED